MEKAMDTGVKVNHTLAGHYAKKPKNTISESDSEPSDSEPPCETSDLDLSSDEEN